MIYLKSFESLSTPIIHERSNKLDFSDLHEDDIVMLLIDKTDKEEISLKFEEIDDIWRTIRTYAGGVIYNLYNSDKISNTSDTIVVKISFNHPYNENYMKQSCIQYFKRIYNNYNVNIFYNLYNFSYVNDPMADVIILIQENNTLRDLKLQFNINESRSDYDTLYKDDIITHLINELDRGEIKMDIDVSDDINDLLKAINNSRYSMYSITNLFNKDTIDQYSDSTIVIKLDMEHPWGGRGHGSFSYDEYMKYCLKDYFKRFYNNYNVNIFYYIREMNQHRDPFCSLYVMIQEDKHDPIKMKNNIE